MACRKWTCNSHLDCFIIQKQGVSTGNKRTSWKLKKGLFTALTAINMHKWLPRGVNEEKIWQAKITNQCFICIIWMSWVIMVNMELLEGI